MSKKKSEKQKQFFNEQVLMKSKTAWSMTYLERTYGWPDSWSVIWRAPEFYGKISGIINSKAKPTPKLVEQELEKELVERFKSPLRCDAKRVAYSYLEKIQEPLSFSKVLDLGKVLDETLYSLDNRIAGEFFNSEQPKLFTAGQFGWILGELAEIRLMVSALRRVAESDDNDDDIEDFFS